MDEDTENLLTGLRLHKDSDGIAEFMLQLEREGPCPPMYAFREGLRFIANKRQEKKIATWMTTARFPSNFCATQFDPKLSSISAKKLEELTGLTWLERGENLLMSGPTGLGKTLLSVHIGKQAVVRGYRTFFIEEKDMTERLIEARNTSPQAYKRRMQHYRSQDLLIIDDVGRVGERSEGFCEILHARHADRKSTIITTNQAIAHWACCDTLSLHLRASTERFLEFAHNLAFRGESLRLLAYQRKNSRVVKNKDDAR